MSEPTGPTAPSSTCPFRGTGSLSYGEEHTAAHHGRTSQIKAHPRRARQAYRRHRRDRSRPWRAPDPGAIDEELKTAAPGLPREVNLSMATLCSAGVPSTSNASSMSRHTVSAIPLTKSLAFVPSRFSSGNSFPMSLTLELRPGLSRLLDM